MRQNKQVLLALAFSGIVYSIWWRFDQPSYEDLNIYLDSVRAWSAGADLYEFRNANGGGFTYPPFAAFLFLPLSRIPLELGSFGLIWGLLLLMVASAGAYLLTRARELSSWVLALTVLVTLLGQPMRDAVHFGQISPVVAFLVIGVPLLSGRGSAAWVGLAAALKLMPAAQWGVWLVAGRLGQALRSLAVFVALGVAAWSVAPTASENYWTHQLWNTGRVGDTASLGNSSLLGLCARHFASVAPILWVLSVAVVVGVMSCAVWGSRHLVHASELLKLGYVLSLVVSPITWGHHAAFVPALALHCVVAAHASVAARNLAVGSLVVWLVPIYDVAKWVDGLNHQAALIVADLRTVSLLVIFALCSLGITAESRGLDGAGPGEATQRSRREPKISLGDHTPGAYHVD